ncbi:MAG: hypothetical protein JXR91_02485, partial [Deltaproteobacteria bacterium]|nr:hypothetical protein [Deltaproteobacteria bacterium]
MNCLYTYKRFKIITAAVIAALLSLLPFNVKAVEEGPWFFDNLTVLDIPSVTSDVFNSDDERGVVFIFSSFNNVIKNQFTAAIEKSPLLYRYVDNLNMPGKTVIEVFSNELPIDFAVRKIKGNEQILIGTVNNGYTLYKILKPAMELSKVPEGIADLLVKGKVTESNILIINYIESLKNEKKKLSKTTKAIFELINTFSDLSNASNCNISDSDFDLNNVDDALSEYLRAYCHYSINNLNEAALAVGKLINPKVNSIILDVATTLSNRIIFKRILEADRHKSPLELAIGVMKNEHEIIKTDGVVCTYQSVVRTLQNSGFESVLGSAALYMVTNFNDRELNRYASSIVMSFYSSGMNVRAEESASFFIAQKGIDKYSKGELLKVRGMTKLQDGSWKAAEDDLSEAEKILGFLPVEAALSKVESVLRTRDYYGTENYTGEPLSTTLEENLKNTKGELLAWSKRLYGEALLKEGKLPQSEILQGIPSNTLYEDAQ